MIKKILLPITLALVFAGVALNSRDDVQAAPAECKKDSDCKSGELCLLVADKPYCTPPGKTGALCGRDEICASKKCDKKAGEKKGVCK